MRIDKVGSFVGPYSFLSNFFPSEVILHGMRFRTVEHAYQAAKTADRIQRRKIQRAVTPGHAKKLGRTLTLRSDWEQVKVGIMKGLLKQKFSDPTLRANLLRTEHAELVEGNYWGDTYWGVCKGEGQNMLGKLLMQIRLELRQ
jgi:ribA/ribD-fused uncharacterized protein